LGLATSPDGIAWAVANNGLPVLEPDNSAAWEGCRVGSPRMVEMGDGTVRLYYTGKYGCCTQKKKGSTRAKLMLGAELERERARGRWRKGKHAAVPELEIGDSALLRLSRLPFGPLLLRNGRGRHFEHRRRRGERVRPHEVDPSLRKDAALS
jgi:hypothetical protein